jgi:CRP-like cAMP-binding protein
MRLEQLSDGSDLAPNRESVASCDGRPTERNWILRMLPREAYAWVRSHLEHVPAPWRAILAEPGDPLRHIYFPETCVASLVSRTAAGTVEVGTIGHEGIVGVSVFLAPEALPAQILWQISGEAQRMPVDVFAEGTERFPELERIVRRYLHAFLVQVAQTSACNGIHPVDQRCARWLIMTHDRVAPTDTFELTHEFIAFLLGVRRATVTEALADLERRGFIRCGRGRITVFDREGLDGAACECPRIVRRHLDQLLGVGPMA